MGEYRPGNRVNSCTQKKHFGANAHGVKPSLSALIVTNAHFTVHFYYLVLTFTRGWVVGISLKNEHINILYGKSMNFHGLAMILMVFVSLCQSYYFLKKL